MSTRSGRLLGALDHITKIGVATLTKGLYKFQTLVYHFYQILDMFLIDGMYSIRSDSLKMYLKIKSGVFISRCKIENRHLVTPSEIVFN